LSCDLRYTDSGELLRRYGQSSSKNMCERLRVEQEERV
jgi:hypothetical protein